VRIALLTPGTGHFFCGSCLRDNALARGLRALGHEVEVVPLYLPMVLEEEQHGPEPRVHMGGINLYLQQKVPGFGALPRWATDALDSPGLLRWASTKGDMTDASGLGDMALSMIRGEEGRQRYAVEELAAWVADGREPDVIVLSNVMLIGVVRTLRAHTQAAIVCSLQGEAPFLDALDPEHADAAWRELSRRAREVDAFVPVSEDYGTLMRERLALDPAQVHVVHNGIELDGLEPADAPPEAPTVGFLARLCPDKGLGTLVDAVLEIERAGRVPGVRLRAAGTLLGADEPWLEEQKQRLAAGGLDGRFEVLPNVDRATKAAFLRSLSVLSVPATYGESFGLYLLEALASGVPFVQPRTAAFPEIAAATGGGLLCEPNDPVALARELETLLLDPIRARELGARGREAVLERFTVEHMARGVGAVCERARE
jgi:glycosyltransferase involved in cell wall biosynthesis